jgi:hypothetical protein
VRRLILLSSLIKLENRQHQAILVVCVSVTLDHLAGVVYSSYTMVPSANIKKDIMDYPNSYELINQGSKRKLNSIQRVSVNTHKTKKFTVTKNMNRYDINLTVTNAIAK